MENENNKVLAQISMLIVGMIIGATGGYYYGAQSVKSVDIPKVDAIELETVLPESANPYSQIKDVSNPFKDADTYQNPFGE